MTVIGALSSLRELGEMSPHKRAIRHLAVKSAMRPVADWTTHPGSMPSRSLTATLKRCLQPM